MTYKHGIRVLELNTGTRTIAALATAVIGLLATAPAADADAFPLNRPVLVTDIDAAISAAGNTGTLAASLRAIADQCDPVIVVVRVAPGGNAGETTTNLIGGSVDGLATGMQAFLAAQAQLGLRPRIFGAPGLDNQAVTTALAIVARKLGGMVYASCDGCDTVAEAITYRANFDARELMLIWPDFTAFNTSSNAIGPGLAIARALGLRARIDQDMGWHKTLSNVSVAGVTGISKDVHWDLQQLDTDADLLNAAQITTLVNAGGGYKFWGSRTCSDEPLFAFESAVRTAQILRDTIADGLLWAIDKPLHPSLAKDIIETINGKFRALKAAGLIVDGRAWLSDAANPAAQLKDGILTIDYDYTSVPPLEQLRLNQRITDRYLANFAERV
ncbi:MAG: phage tail sheath subtilisin-like domain-containing protein [Sphingomonadales bacterium]|jgi:phage tail sheath protein FI